MLDDPYMFGTTESHVLLWFRLSHHPTVNEHEHCVLQNPIKEEDQERKHRVYILVSMILWP
jgi:hypothetical protein